MKIVGHRAASVFQRYNIVDEAQTRSVMRLVEKPVYKPRSASVMSLT
jgi:hypothetical protein